MNDVCARLGGYFSVDAMVPVLLGAACSDKKFIRDPADAALNALGISCGVSALPFLAASAGAKSAKVECKAACTMECILVSLASADLVQYTDLQQLHAGARNFSQGKLAETRKAGQRMVQCLDSKAPLPTPTRAK